jgi:hypothetical protein
MAVYIPNGNICTIPRPSKIYPNSFGLKIYHLATLERSLFFRHKAGHKFSSGFVTHFSHLKVHRRHPSHQSQIIKPILLPGTLINNHIFPTLLLHN